MNKNLVKNIHVLANILKSFSEMQEVNNILFLPSVQVIKIY